MKNKKKWQHLQFYFLDNPFGKRWPMQLLDVKIQFTCFCKQLKRKTLSIFSWVSSTNFPWGKRQIATKWRLQHFSHVSFKNVQEVSRTKTTWNSIYCSVNLNFSFQMYKVHEKFIIEYCFNFNYFSNFSFKMYQVNEISLKQ